MVAALKGLFGLVALLAALFGGYQALREGPRQAYCDAAALLGFADACRVEPPPDSASILDRMT